MVLGVGITVGSFGRALFHVPVPGGGHLGRAATVLPASPGAWPTSLRSLPAPEIGGASLVSMGFAVAAALTGDVLAP
jgi:hypothetical protein